MFNESNRALSWNSMPILLRISNNSRSRIRLMSRPKTYTVPASGLCKPRAVFNVQRVEQGALLEQHADLTPDFEQFPLPHPADVPAEDVYGSGNCSKSGVRSA